MSDRCPHGHSTNVFCTPCLLAERDAARAEVERLRAALEAATNPRFPVLFGPDEKALSALGCPRSVPWSLLAPHEERAQRNHGQTLAELARRGGLAPCEMLAVVEGRKWRRMSDADAVAQLKSKLAPPAQPVRPEGDGARDDLKKWPCDDPGCEWCAERASIRSEAAAVEHRRIVERLRELGKQLQHNWDIDAVSDIAALIEREGPGGAGKEGA